MEGLTKENYWNQMMEKYPEAMKIFCNWIDQYKQEVGWDQLFGAHTKSVDGSVVCSREAPKFHDLPFEFQNGVLARFDIECFHGVMSGRGNAKYESGRPNYV